LVDLVIGFALVGRRDIFQKIGRARRQSAVLRLTPDPAARAIDHRPRQVDRARWILGRACPAYFLRPDHGLKHRATRILLGWATASHRTVAHAVAPCTIGFETLPSLHFWLLVE